jgi:hypothetical protein
MYELTGLREHQPATYPLEQRFANSIFQQFQLAADGLGRQVQRL